MIYKNIYISILSLISGCVAGVGQWGLGLLTLITLAPVCTNMIQTLVHTCRGLGCSNFIETYVKRQSNTLPFKLSLHNAHKTPFQHYCLLYLCNNTPYRQYIIFTGFIIITLQVTYSYW